MLKNLLNYWNDFLDLVFPRLCEVCKKPLQGQELHICTLCRIEIPRLSTDSMLYDAFTKRFASYPEVHSQNAFLVFMQKGAVQQLVYGLKYRNKPEIGRLLGMMFAQEYKPVKADMILPVPLHPKRERERGYNQSKMFAEGIARIWDIPVEDKLLLRTKHTVSQTGKSKEEREKNVSGIFVVADPERIKNKEIILTDDVMTTGATLESCIVTLVEAGCRKIHIITIAAAHY